MKGKSKSRPPGQAYSQFETVAHKNGVSLILNHETGYYYKGWYNPEKKVRTADGREVRKPGVTRESLRTRNLAEARKYFAAFAKKHNPEADEHKPLSVNAALAKAIERSGSKSARHQRNMRGFANYFETFMHDNYPEIQLWCRVRQEHVDDYAEHLATKKHPLKPKSIAAYAGQVVQTARQMRRLYEHTGQYVQLYMPTRFTATTDEPEKVWLTAEELLIALAVCREFQKHTSCPIRRAGYIFGELGFLLGSFGSMRLTEIARLSVHSFDYRDSLVDLSDITTKNKSSRRVVPLPRIVMQRIVDIIEAREGNILHLIYLCDRERAPETFGQQGNDSSIARAMRRCLRRAHQLTKNERFLRISPKDAARKSWFNLAETAGAEPPWSQACAGHSTGKLADKVYRDMTSKRRIPMMRRNVTDRIEQHLTDEMNRLGVKQLGDFPSTPEFTNLPFTYKMGDEDAESAVA